MIKAVIFDLDDTLYDESQFVKGGFSAVAAHLSKVYHIRQARVYESLLEALNKYGRGKIFQVVLSIFKIEANKRLINRLINIYRYHPRRLFLTRDASLVLRRLRKKGFRIGLLTDGNPLVQTNKIKLLGIARFFDCIICSRRFGKASEKPNPFIYRKIFRRMEVLAKETIYVGDDPHKDFVQAKKLGMTTLRIIKGRFRKSKVRSDYDAHSHIHSLGELFRILVKLEKKGCQR